jgi:hypothetical protein
MPNVNRVRPANKSESVCLLRWTFQKDDKAITCQIEGNEAASCYDVSVVPHWDIASAVVEEAETPFGAFRRHAEIAIRLRQAGWAVARRSR